MQSNNIITATATILAGRKTYAADVTLKSLDTFILWVWYFNIVGITIGVIALAILYVRT